MSKPYFEIDSAISDMKNFIIYHKNELTNIAEKAALVFQSYCYILVAKYFYDKNYMIILVNKEQGIFKLKNGPRGNPNNFSYFKIFYNTKQLFDLRNNLSVYGFAEDTDNRDTAAFSLDIAIIKSKSVPKSKHPVDGYTVKNKNLVTFFSVKHMYGSPELLANFSGLVLMTHPKFLDAKETRDTLFPYHKQIIPLPSLLLSGDIGINGKKVIEAYINKDYKISVIGNVPLKKSITE